MSKVCNACNQEKELESFKKHASGKFGKHPTCRECLKLKTKQWRAANADKVAAYNIKKKQYYEEHKAPMLQRQKEYRKENREDLIKRNKEYYAANKEVMLRKQREYNEKNRDAVLQRHREYYERNKDVMVEKMMEHYWNNRDAYLERAKKWREENPERDAENHRRYREENRAEYNEYRRKLMAEKMGDPEFKILHNLRKRIRHAVTAADAKKCAKTEELLGCSVEEFRRHLEMMFDDKMSWENYGSYWHIDHEKPCASFDLTGPEQQKECFHWTNMIPMEARENMSKGAKLMGL